jgi:hypothetical protein
MLSCCKEDEMSVVTAASADVGVIEEELFIVKSEREFNSWDTYVADFKLYLYPAYPLLLF